MSVKDDREFIKYEGARALDGRPLVRWPDCSTAEQWAREEDIFNPQATPEPSDETIRRGEPK